MKRTSSIQGARLVALCAMIWSVLGVAASPPVFSVHFLGNISDGEYSQVYGINNAGQAVGVVAGSASDCPNACPVIWEGTTPTILESVQGADGYGPLSINNSGQVAGTVIFPNFTVTTLAATWINGTPTLLPAPTAQFYASYAFSINDSGQIVGAVQGGNNAGGGIAVVATVWNGLTPSLLDTPPGCGAESQANGINNNGLIVGYVDCYGYLIDPAVLWRGTTFTLLELDGTVYRAGGGVAVNDLGLIVGYAANEAGFLEAAAWPQGALTYLGILAGGNSSSATAVNSHGVIVGTSNYNNSDQASETHAVLWSHAGAQLQDLNELISPELAAQLVLTQATGINDECSIVVNGYNQSKKEGPRLIGAFLLTLNDPASCANGL